MTKQTRFQKRGAHAVPAGLAKAAPAGSVQLVWLLSVFLAEAHCLDALHQLCEPAVKCLQAALPYCLPVVSLPALWVCYLLPLSSCYLRVWALACHLITTVKAILTAGSWHRSVLQTTGCACNCAGHKQHSQITPLRQWTQYTGCALSLLPCASSRLLSMLAEDLMNTCLHSCRPARVCHACQLGLQPYIYMSLERLWQSSVLTRIATIALRISGTHSVKLKCAASHKLPDSY